MNEFIKQLQEQLNVQFDEALEGSVSNLQMARRSIGAAEIAIGRFREFIRTYALKDNEEEIHLYKEVVPTFLAHLIYYVRIYQMECRKPVGGIEVEKRFYRRELQRILQFFMDNRDSYQYYRTGSDFLDGIYFVRKSQRLPSEIEEYSCILDKDFCTIQGYKQAKIIAYQRLQDYLNAVLERPGEKQKVPSFPTADFKWTGPKAALVELLYALVFSGMINNGQVEVKGLADFLENVFQVHLGSIYRTKQEMYTRRNPTAFLDLLRKRLRDGLDDADEKYRRV